MDRIEEIEERWDYPNADKLDWNNAKDDIGRLLSRIKELEERQKWIDEVGRPLHPDDERPWVSAYLDCRARIEELEAVETDLKLSGSIIEKQIWERSSLDADDRIEELKKRVKELEDWIKEHRDTEIGGNYKIEQMELRDEKLYKLVSK